MYQVGEWMDKGFSRVQCKLLYPDMKPQKWVQLYTETEAK